MPQIERKNYDALGPAVGPYSHAVKNGNTLYLSGFTAFGTEAQGKDIYGPALESRKSELDFPIRMQTYIRRQPVVAAP